MKWKYAKICIENALNKTRAWSQQLNVTCSCILDGCQTVVHVVLVFRIFHLIFHPISHLNLIFCQFSPIRQLSPHTKAISRGGWRSTCASSETRIFSNCSCCVAGQQNTLGGKHCLPSVTYKSSQVVVIDLRKRWFNYLWQDVLLTNLAMIMPLIGVGNKRPLWLKIIKITC